MACALSALSCVEDRTDQHRSPLTAGTVGGGTAISVHVATPADGALFPAGSVVSISGHAAIGEAAPVADAALVLAVDVSGSTQLPGCDGDANNDGTSGSVLDCEIAAALALLDAVESAGTIGEMGVVFFATGAAVADVGPGPGTQMLTAPGADENGNGVRDIEEVLRSAQIGGAALFTPVSVGSLTSYGAGLGEMINALGSSALSRRVGVMLSDGLNNTPPSVASALAGGSAGAAFHTFAVGPDASCSDPNPEGDLQDIADLTGGTCTNVPDPADLPNVLPDVIQSVLSDVVVTIEGGTLPAPTALPVNIVPVTPQNGPVTVLYDALTAALDPGTYSICAAAHGQDGGGPGSVVECVQIRVNAAPVASCAPAEVIADASCQAGASIDAGSFDPDGDDFTCSQDPPDPYVLVTTPVTLTCTDEHGAAGACSAAVTVIDVTPPEVTVATDAVSLWPPNHGHRAFTLSDCIAAVEDNCGGSLDPDEVGVITRITSDEPENGPADGNTCDDAVITGDATANLRAERSGQGDGRVYRVHFEVSDADGNQTGGSCVVQVVHDQSSASDPAIDSGCAFCVGDGCGSCPSSSPGC